MAYIPSTRGQVSTLNSTTTPLTGGATYTGTGEDVSAYASISVAATIAPTTAAGTLKMQFSIDNATWDRSIDIPITSDNAASTIHSVIPIAQYFRVLYVNGSDAQSTLRIQTIYNTSGRIAHPTSRLDQTMLVTSDVINTRAVVFGRNDGGNYSDVNIDSERHLEVAIHSPVTAFGEVRVSSLSPRIQLVFPYNLNTDIVSVATNGTATATVSDSVAQISTGATAGSSGSVQSVQRIKYRAGQGTIARLTAAFTTGSAVGSVQEAGIGDTIDGFFTCMSGSSFGVARRRAGVDTFISQSAFNIDVLDGSGNVNNPSGFEIKPEFGNVFQIQYQWLGFGAITFYTESDLTGTLVPFHRIQHVSANLTTTVLNPTLPIRYYVSNGSNAANSTIRFASSAAFTEGDTEPTGPVNAFKHATTTGTNTMVFTLLNNTTINGVANRDKVIFKLASFVADGVAAVTYDIYKNATLTGGAYENIDSNRSMVSFNTGSSWTVGSGNRVLFAGLSKVDSKLIETTGFELVLRPGETLTVIGNGSNAGAAAGFTWIEDF